MATTTAIRRARVNRRCCDDTILIWTQRRRPDRREAGRKTSCDTVESGADGAAQPHFLQNFAPGGKLLAQSGQFATERASCAASTLPQALQNFVPSLFAVPHFPQFAINHPSCLDFIKISRNQYFQMIIALMATCV
ncbi:hypothetical protein QC826_03500 [Rugamonas sp. DEMB1]|nr:hypothetical protein [Rugamonas sp. DEMB1]WGG51348.1 hypothetical protein QC826_03500 [Rugamonas sp. DEMB1]